MTHDPITQTITVTPTLPPGPMVLCDAKFLHALAQVEREIAHLAITDAATAQTAANLLNRLTNAGTALEKARATVKAPILAAGRAIDDAARAPQGRIDKAKRDLNQALVNYRAEQQRAAEAAERARKEAEARAAEQAKRVTVPILDLDDCEEVAPPVAPAQPAGVAFRAYLRIASIDVTKLPEKFIIRTADEKALRSAFVQGWKDGDPLPECAGVVFTVDRMAVSRGGFEL